MSTTQILFLALFGISLYGFGYVRADGKHIRRLFKVNRRTGELLEEAKRFRVDESTDETKSESLQELIRMEGVLTGRVEMMGEMIGRIDL